MNDQQLLRYSRQIMLPQLDYEGQKKLLTAKVLIIGLGGLGSPVAMYLAAAGIGELRLCDFDEVDLSNLQRQIAHTTERVGQSKVLSAAVAIQQLNPEIELVTLSERLSESQLTSQVAKVDLVIDASDNFETRFAVNAACVKQQTPLISGAVIRFEGQVTTIVPGGPCYRCLYQDDDDTTPERCSETGVLAPLPGIIGSIQATEALKQIAGIGKPLQGKLLLMDALTMEWRTLRYRRDSSCPVCNRE